MLTISLFLADCTPDCRNGGSCFHNSCQCPKNFVGRQCQHSVDRCAPHKIGFNGSVRCVGTSTSMRCTLTCPPGIDFDSPPASAYTCSYESGAFTPATAPKCVYGKQIFDFVCSFINLRIYHVSGEGVQVIRKTVEGDVSGKSNIRKSKTIIYDFIFYINY